MKTNNITLSRYYTDLIKNIEYYYKYIFLISILSLFIMLAKLNAGEFKTIYLLIIFELISILLSKYAINFFEYTGYTKYKYILNASIIIGVHICVGLSVLGVYIAQLSF